VRDEGVIEFVRILSSILCPVCGGHDFEFFDDDEEGIIFCKNCIRFLRQEEIRLFLKS